MVASAAMRNEGPRAQLVLIAAALLVFLVAQIAIAGPSGGPRARDSANLTKKVKSLTSQVASLTSQAASLTSQVSSLNGQVAALEGKSIPTSLPPSGPASGDLTGSYPGPSLSPPPAPTLVGLPDSNSVTCAGATNNAWNDFEPGGLNPVGYYRDRQGRVFIQGTVQRCGNPGVVVTTLPAGFRPPKDENFAIVGPGATFSSLGVGASGDVDIQISSSTNFFGLDGVNFRCGPSGANGCP
jgi:hypothetical protein